MLLLEQGVAIRPIRGRALRDLLHLALGGANARIAFANDADGLFLVFRADFLEFRGWFG